MSKFFRVFQIPDLRRKILKVGVILLIFRALAAVPIPGIDAAKLQQFLNSNQLFGFLNVFSGGGLENLSVMMLGVGPYITATIIMQLLTVIFPSLKKAYYEEGTAGRAKFNRYSRYLTVPLAILQGYGFLNLLMAQGVIGRMFFLDIVSSVIVITAGSVLLMWLGELISEYKIGNGISFIIFAGIVSSLPRQISAAVLNYNPATLPTYVSFAVLAVVIVAGVVFVSEGERKVPVSYAKQVRGNKLYGGASSYLPLRVNQAGVIPIIFAISVLLFPQFLAQAVSVASPDLSVKLTGFVNSFLGNFAIYGAVYFFLVVIFTFFYTAVTFDPGEISKNLQQHGGFVPGIRPGKPTSDFIARIVYRITFFGALFLGAIAVLPTLTQVLGGVGSIQIGGTALLIVVAVALEIMQQLNSHLAMREYDD